MDQKSVFNYLGVIFLCTLVFVSGFYFGYKYFDGKSEKTEFVAGVKDIQESAQQVQNTEIITKELVGAIWIKAGQQPVCPSDHPIKGKYDGTTGYYYTKENKSFDRVKPVVCFATEDYAQNEAGFVKKY